MDSLIEGLALPCSLLTTHVDAHGPTAGKSIQPAFATVTILEAIADILSTVTPILYLTSTIQTHEGVSDIQQTAVEGPPTETAAFRYAKCQAN